MKTSIVIHPKTFVPLLFLVFQAAVFFAATPSPRLEVEVGAYRRLLSTRRRAGEALVSVRFPGGTKDLASGRLTLQIVNSATNAVSSKEFRLPSHDVPTGIVYHIPLDQRLPAGRYSIEGELVIPAHDGVGPARERASAPFEIAAPRFWQTLVDQDGTLLVNGVPFFPVGLVGADSGRCPKLGTCGFNALASFSETLREGEFGIASGLDLAVGYGMRCFVPPHSKELAESEAFYEYYASPGYGLEHHPAIAMWDVTADLSSPDGTKGADWLRTTDRDHPLYAEFPILDVFASQASRVDVAGFVCPVDVEAALALGRRLEDEVLPRASAFCIFTAKSGTPARVVRASAYAALVHGARGILWKATDGFRPEEDEAFADVAHEIAGMAGGLASSARRSFVSGDLHGLVCGTAANNRFLILVNVADKRVEADFEVAELAKVAKVSLPFFKEGDDAGKDILVISDKDLEKPVIGDDMGMPVPTLEDDILVATDAEIEAIAAARKRAREKPQEPPAPAITLKARATGRAGEVVLAEKPAVKTRELFCGRVRHVFPPRGTLVYRW